MESLDPILVEDKDKQKVLTSTHRWADRRPSPYFLRQSFRTPVLVPPSSIGSIPREATILRIDSPFVIGAYNNPIPEDHLEGLEIGSTAGASDSGHSPLIGDHLQLFANQWEAKNTDMWVYRQ